MRKRRIIATVLFVGGLFFSQFFNFAFQFSFTATFSSKTENDTTKQNRKCAKTQTENDTKLVWFIS
jgi:Sec-independent protein secretion pathway component TatC